MAPLKVESDCVTEPHLLGISRIIIAWAFAERSIADSLWETATGHSFATMTEDQMLSIALVVGMGTKFMLGILRAVVRARFPDSADSFDKIANALEKMGKARNAVAHAHWQSSERPRAIQTTYFNTMGRLRTEIHAFTPEELEGLAQRICVGTLDLVQFLKDRGFLKTPREPVDKCELPTPAPHRAPLAQSPNKERDSQPPTPDKPGRQPR